MKIYLAGEFGGNRERERVVFDNPKIKRLYSFFYKNNGLDFMLKLLNKENK